MGRLTDVARAGLHNGSIVRRHCCPVYHVLTEISSFLAGSLPLSISLSPRQMRLLTACGTGVLVGTALIVIIPEGVETLYSARMDGHIHPETSLASSGAKSTFLTSKSVPQIKTYRTEGDLLAGAHIPLLHARVKQVEDDYTGPDDGMPDLALSNKAGDAPLASKAESGTEGTDSSQEHDTFEPHAWIGVSLILGFILMYLVDRLPQLVSSATQQRTSYISLDRLSLHRSPSQVEDTAQDSLGPPHGHSGSRPSSTTVGLVIHAAADGIALGASSTSSSSKLGFVVFLALMIHKAPAAFGLTAVLLKQGVSRRRARTHLVIFSLAAPVGALATWSAAHVVGGGDYSETGTNFATGVLLLFSGGTFL